MKKILVLLISITLSCSSDDNNNSNIVGCTDPVAINYNPEATQSGGDCLYSLVGDWTAYYYTINDVDILGAFSYFDIHVYGDSSYFIEAETIDGTYVQSTGMGSYDEEYNTLTLTPDNGNTVEVWNITYFDGQDLFMNYTDESGSLHESEWVKY